MDLARMCVNLAAAFSAHLEHASLRPLVGIEIL
jgi:hypothetical protein